MIPFVSPRFGNVRVFLDDQGNPWFVAADVCRALGVGNASKALMALDEDEKGITTSNTLGGSQQMAIVSEPGLYSLILRSRKPAAKAFKRWVTHEVIPAVRSKGRYEVTEAASRTKIEEAEAELRRIAASCYVDLAESKLYPDSTATLFKAEAISLATGRPVTELLPPMPGDGREHWLTPTDLAARLSEDLGRRVTPKAVGHALITLRLHGTDDSDHRFSWPYHNMHPVTHRQVTSYKYDPAVVYPRLLDWR
jgi:prophage antirepressor-like protein